jgi:hypothetical protein
VRRAFWSEHSGMTVRICRLRRAVLVDGWE